MLGSILTPGWLSMLSVLLMFGQSHSQPRQQWVLGDIVFEPGKPASADETAAKDPSIVYFENQWHLFYTSRGRGEYTTSYVAAPTLDGLNHAPRIELTQIRGQTSRYACAPQVFFFTPLQKWVLIFQTRDAHYQPAFSLNSDISKPEGWSGPEPLLRKDDDAKWIDFWIVCDSLNAYLFYTRQHNAVMMRSTPLADFPHGWGKAKPVFNGVHEAVHVYKVYGQERYHMIYELNEKGKRSFGLAQAHHLSGPWNNVTREFATPLQLVSQCKQKWTHNVSHGEFLRKGYDQFLEYEPDSAPFLIQGLLEPEHQGPYEELPWRLGLILKKQTGFITPD